MDISQALQPGTALGGMDLYPIFEITVAEQKGTVIQTLEQIGFTNAAQDIQKNLDKGAIQILNYLTRLAESAAKSKVPYRSGTLRDTIQASQPYFRSGKNFEQSRTVSAHGDYSPPYKSHETDAAQLALVLDTEAFIRSRASLPVDGYTAVPAFSPTTNWTIKAQNEFERKKGKLLLSRFI